MSGVLVIRAVRAHPESPNLPKSVRAYSRSNPSPLPELLRHNLIQPYVTDTNSCLHSQSRPAPTRTGLAPVRSGVTRLRHSVSDREALAHELALLLDRQELDKVSTGNSGSEYGRVVGSLPGTPSTTSRVARLTGRRTHAQPTGQQSPAARESGTHEERLRHCPSSSERGSSVHCTRGLGFAVHTSHATDATRACG